MIIQSIILFALASTIILLSIFLADTKANTFITPTLKIEENQLKSISKCNALVELNTKNNNKQLLTQTPLTVLSDIPEYDESILLPETCPIVLIHFGKLPNHIFDCIDQLHVMGAQTIYFIVDNQTSFQRLSFCNNIKPILSTEPLNINSIIENFMTDQQLEKCIYLQNDVLIYVPLGVLYEIWTNTFGSNIATIDTILYVGSLDSLKQQKSVSWPETFTESKIISFSTIDQAEWTLTTTGKKIPVVQNNNDYFRVSHLHITSKLLYLYVSTCYMDPTDIIQGNKFKNIADIQFSDSDSIKNYIPTDIKTPIIYVKTDYLSDFFTVVFPKLSNIILLTHNSDYTVDENHIQYLENPKLLGWFAQNCQITHPKLFPIPIGIANSQWEHGNIDYLIQSMKSVKPKQNALYVNLGKTHPIRTQVLEYFEQHPTDNIIIENGLSYSDYLEHMKSFLYVCAPRGNGPDTHRLWEAAYLGVVPITYDALFQTIPCIPDNYIIIKDESTYEFTPLSHENYQSLITSIDNGRLYCRMSYWNHRIQTFRTCMKEV